MSFDPVPWLVGGGAEHSPEVARLLAYAAFGGTEGVIGLGDFLVQELDTPAGSVRVAPGAASILNRAAGGSYQAYAARLPSEVTVAIPATGSGSGRSDLIVARVEDPFVAGEPWDEPGDPTVGPYIFIRVIENVDPNTTTVPSGNGSAIPLARIDLPASTGTVLEEHITDLRELPSVAARRHRTLLTVFPEGNNDFSAKSWTTWPSAANQTIVVPEWAVTANVRVIMGGVRFLHGNVYSGRIRTNLGGRLTPQTGMSNEATRETLFMAGRLLIPSTLRGTTTHLRIEATQDSSTNGTIRADDYTTITMDVEFVEAVTTDI